MQRHNGPNALCTLTLSTPRFQSRSFNKLWNLTQSSVLFCLAKGESDKMTTDTKTHKTTIDSDLTRHREGQNEEQDGLHVSNSEIKKLDGKLLIYTATCPSAFNKTHTL